MPTGDVVLNRDASLRVPQRLKALEMAVGGSVGALDAGRLAEELMGDAVFANVVMLGFAWQSGLVPVSLAALERAIEMNAVAPAANRRALGLGRLAATSPDILAEAIGGTAASPNLDETIARRADFLTGYQDAAYAQRYRKALAPVLALGDEPLARAAAQSLFRLMSYKDEYEVARLHRDADFARRIAREFGPGAKLAYHLAPPFWPGAKDARGRPQKRRFPAWAMRPAFAVLARMKGARGGMFDPFGWHPERRMERALIVWFEGLLARAGQEARPESLRQWHKVMDAPQGIRGYGPVKLEAAEKVRAEVEKLLETL